MGRVAAALGSVVGVAVVLLILALEVGGVTFRKDCATGPGGVSKSWDVQWFIPIPYLFRPSESGCTVHTGTRVALDGLGLFPIPAETASGIVQKAKPPSDPGQAYYKGLYVILADLKRANDQGLG